MANAISKTDQILADDLKFISDLKVIVHTAKLKAYQAADLYNVAENWLIGKRIVEQEQNGQTRAQYGKHVIEIASKVLTEEFGKGYSPTQIRYFSKFYLIFNYLPIQQTVSAEFNQVVSQIRSQSSNEIQRTMSVESQLATFLPLNLSWSHYERLMRIDDDNDRD